MHPEHLLKLYRKELTVPPLSAEQEEEIFAACRAGDATAREKIILANLRLVYWLAAKLSRDGLDMAELLAVGNMALIRAVDKFTGWGRFVNYAVPWITGAMRHAIHEAAAIPLSERAVRKLKPIEEARTQIGEEMESDPTVKELAAALRMDIDDLACIFRALAVLSLEEERERSALQIADMDDVEGEAISLADGAQAGKLLKYLRTRERQVISAQFGLGDAEMPAIKERRREQIVQSGLAKLRELMEMGTETLTQAACLPCPHYRKVGGRTYCARTGATIVITDPLPSECQNALKTKPI